MDKTLKMLIAGGAFALMAGYANAAMVATTASDISVRSGPGDDYPEVGLATRGSNAVLDGCMEGSSWCRIEVNGLRGWAHADYLNVMYEGSPVILKERRTELSVPVVTYELRVFRLNRTPAIRIWAASAKSIRLSRSSPILTSTLPIPSPMTVILPLAASCRPIPVWLKFQIISIGMCG